MNEKKMRFLLTAAFCVLTVLTVNAEATTANDAVCPAGQIHVCFTKTDTGTLAGIVVDNRGHAVTDEDDCENADVTVFYGCQPIETVRAEEHERCEQLGGRFYWSTTRGGRCVEQRPREDDSPAPPPTPPTPPVVQTPPQTPPPQPPVVIITPPAPPGPGVTNPPVLPPVAPVPPGPPATCPDCILNAPDPCADIPGVADELGRLAEITALEWTVHTDLEEKMARVLYLRERAGECAEDGLFAEAERILAAMEPPETVPLPPDQIPYEQEESCWDTWCPWVLGGAVATVVTGVILGVVCGTGGCDPVVDVYNQP